MMLRRATALLAISSGLLLTGCMLPGIKIDPQAISYDAPGGALVLTEVEQPKRPLLRVAEVEDLRPDASKKGSKPRAWYLLVANWRIGDYVTSDSSWGGSSVASQATASLADALKRTDYFEEVRVEPAAGRYTGEGLVLEAKIDEFVARQRYNGYKYFMGYWETSEEYGAPKGTCRITYRLIDPELGDVVHQNTVEATPSDGKKKIADVGVRAMREAQTKLVNDILATLDRY